MASARLNAILTLLGTLLITYSSFSQTTQSYRNHEEIDVGGGMKVEILKCTGEGPAEICDCIYFKEKRQTGTRMKQSADRLKEEERAANIAKNLNSNTATEKKVNSVTRPGGDRSDLTIPPSITIKSNKPKVKPVPSLDEAARQADARAKVSSEKIKEEVLKEGFKGDSSEMDKVFIPPVSNEVKAQPPIAASGEVEKKPLVTAPVTFLKNQNTIENTAAAKDTSVGVQRPVVNLVDSLISTSKQTLVVARETAVNKSREDDSLSLAIIDSVQQNWIRKYDRRGSETNNVDTGATLKMKAAKEANQTDSNALQPSLTTPGVGEALSTENTTPFTTNTVNVIGKSAEVNVDGNWEKATIVDKESEYLFKVHYKGKSNSDDEWVSVTQIRNIDTASAVSTSVASEKINANCSFTAPAPPVKNAAIFSKEVAKRKIYENYLPGKNAGKRPMKLGMTFISLNLQEPYVNAVSISANHTIEVKLPLAPTGAMIYPVDAAYKICEQKLGKTTSKMYKESYACFRNKQGAWSCENLK